MDPDALKNKPELPWWLEHYITDFNELSGFRIKGMNGPNPIDLPSIILYTEVYNIQNVQRFLIVIKKLDTLYLNHSYKREGS